MRPDRLVVVVGLCLSCCLLPKVEERSRAGGIGNPGGHGGSVLFAGASAASAGEDSLGGTRAGAAGNASHSALAGCGGSSDAGAGVAGASGRRTVSTVGSNSAGAGAVGGVLSTMGGLPSGGTAPTGGVSTLAGAPTEGVAGGDGGNGGESTGDQSGCSESQAGRCSEVNTTQVPGMPGQSCDDLPADACHGESCCTTLLVPGCTFAMGRSDSGCDAYVVDAADEQDTSDGDPEHRVTVENFYLDKYEVTVGRFRAFVSSGSWAPARDADGSHPAIPGSGWRKPEWDENLPTSKAQWDAALQDASSCQDYATWTQGTASNETRPINCVSWYEALAFCIWDGGRLPTEAEWEYAASGGDQNRLFPWGAAAPDCALANFLGCLGSVAAVGASTGVGRWGHEDFAGNVSEWVFDGYIPDWYDGAAASGISVCNVTPVATRALRGGGLNHVGGNLRAAYRGEGIPTARYGDAGFRCARSVPTEIGEGGTGAVGGSVGAGGVGGENAGAAGTPGTGGNGTTGGSDTSGTGGTCSSLAYPACVPYGCC